MTEFSLIIEKLDALEKQIKPDFPVWLSVKQAAKYIGLSESSVRKMVSAGQMPYRRLPLAESGAIRFSKKMIDLWLLSGEVKPTRRVRQTFAELL